MNLPPEVLQTIFRHHCDDAEVDDDDDAQVDNAQVSKLHICQVQLAGFRERPADQQIPSATAPIRIGEVPMQELTCVG
jgi:hypothetical protein